jgi:hypothetical protein
MAQSTPYRLAQAEKALEQSAAAIKKAAEALRTAESKPPVAGPPKEGTLGAIVAQKLRRRKGVTLEEVMSLTNPRDGDPKPHSARATISKTAARAGLQVERDGSRYRAVA